MKTELLGTAEASLVTD